MKEKLEGTVIISAYTRSFLVANGEELIPISSSTMLDFLIPERVTCAECSKGKDGYECFPISKESRVKDYQAQNHMLIPMSKQW